MDALHPHNLAIAAALSGVAAVLVGYLGAPPAVQLQVAVVILALVVRRISVTGSWRLLSPPVTDSRNEVL